MGHYYTTDGRAMHEIPKARGNGMKPTGPADALKLGLLPSVTTVMSILAKRGIQEWEIGHYLDAVSDCPRAKGEDLKDWKKRLKEIVKPRMEEGANAGTEIHAGLQSILEKTPFPAEISHLEPILARLSMDMGKICGFATIEAEKVFTAPYWGYGGTVDGNTLGEDGVRYIFDLKTTSGKNYRHAKGKVKDEHAMQLAAYRVFFPEEKARCFILHFNRDNPEYSIVEATKEELLRGWNLFRHLLSYWRLSNGFEALN